MCIMFQQRLPRCPRLSTEQSKSASTCSFRLAVSASVIYEVGVSTSGEPALVVYCGYCCNYVVCVWCRYLFVCTVNVFLYLLAISSNLSIL